VQRAENPRGACEIYHYNSDGTLDWGYFQINTVHLKRAGVNLRDLLDCKANIDFAYKLYTERGFEPWSHVQQRRVSSIPEKALIRVAVGQASRPARVLQNPLFAEGALCPELAPPA
jgi:hypothetical protein